MDDKRVLLDLTPEELGDFLKSLGQPAFRAGSGVHLAAPGRGLCGYGQPACHPAGAA